jgi:hypothetical protein
MYVCPRPARPYKQEFIFGQTEHCKPREEDNLKHAGRIRHDQTLPVWLQRSAVTLVKKDCKKLIS